jgi:hypothetical protein
MEDIIGLFTKVKLNPINGVVFYNKEQLTKDLLGLQTDLLKMKLVCLIIPDEFTLTDVSIDITNDCIHYKLRKPSNEIMLKKLSGLFPGLRIINVDL